MSSKPSRFIIPTGTDLSTDPDVFPVLIGRNFTDKKEPEWSSVVTQAANGRESVQSRWSYPRWNFTVSHEFLRHRADAEDLGRIFAFFCNHKGRYQEFLYLDSDDTSASNTFAIAPGGVSTFQITRSQGLGGNTFFEPVLAFYGTPVIYVDGVVEAGVTFGEYGTVTFTSAPAAGKVLSWTGTALYVCRFDDDMMSAKQFARQFWEGQGVSFHSIKP